MLRLVQNINFYIMFEVLEVSWKELDEKLSEARDVDDVIAANESFLEKIISQLLLDEKSQQIASELRTIFDLIVKMSAMCENFHKVAIDEINSRTEHRKKRAAGLLTEQDVDKYHKHFVGEFKPKLKAVKNTTSLNRKSFQV